MRGSGNADDGVFLQEHLSYTLEDSPFRLWNAELACQSACHQSGMLAYWYMLCVKFTER